jgi:hypothetical protein
MKTREDPQKHDVQRDRGLWITCLYTREPDYDILQNQSGAGTSQRLDDAGANVAAKLEKPMISQHWDISSGFAGTLRSFLVRAGVAG